jgi:hypothetical protein
MAFWHYNRILLSRILLAAFYSAFLFLGLTLALLALQHLLGVDVRDRLYADLGIILSGIFNTWFFLAGLPDNWKEWEDNQEYPHGLKIFSGYVLIPLVMVYLIILYLYAGKVVIQQEWPLTWMGYLVLGFSISGILALLLIWPVRNQAERTMIFLFNKWYLIILIPLTLLLLITIGRQINHYGITPNRYILAMTTLWILLICLFYILRGFNRIIYIPVSLALLCFFAALGGPLNLIEVSVRNQKKRLQDLLAQNAALCEGKLCAPAEKINPVDLKEISSKLNFLNNQKDTSWIQEYLAEKIIDSLRSEGYDAGNGYMFVAACMEIIGDYPGSGVEDDFENLGNSQYIISPTEMAVDISGYQSLVDYNYSAWGDKEDIQDEVLLGQFPVKVHFISNRNALQFEDPNGDKTEFKLQDSLQTWVLKWGNPEKARPAELRIHSSTTQYLLSMSVESIHLTREESNQFRVREMRGKMMIAPKAIPD